MKFRYRMAAAWNYLRRGAALPAPDSDFWYEHTPYTTSSGIDVTEDTALTYSAVWACVRVISEDLASLPLFVYRREDEQSKSRAMDHPCYTLLHDAPNPEMSAMAFREAMQLNVLLWGNAYAEIQRNYRGDSMALWPLAPDHMTVKRDERNELVYEYKLTDTGEIRIFQKEQILHISGISLNGLVGLSPISYQRETIALGLGEVQFGGSFFKNGAASRVVLTHPGRIGQEAIDRLRSSWEKMYGGASNAHKTVVIEEGMDLKTLSIPNTDAQWIEGRGMSIADICRVYRVPPPKIADLTHATYSNIEELNRAYATDTLRPWCVRWEQAIHQRLLGGSEEYIAEHLLDALMRGDLKSRYDAYAVARNWGWMNPDEIRALENMNPIPDGKGKVYLQPLNMVELGAKPPEKAPNSAPNQANPSQEDIDLAREINHRLKLVRSESK